MATIGPPVKRARIVEQESDAVISGGDATLNNVTITGTLGVTGATTVSDTLDVVAKSTLGVVAAGALTATSLSSAGALGVTGTSTLGVVGTGALTSTSISSTGTLGVTGTSTLATVNCGPLNSGANNLTTTADVNCNRIFPNSLIIGTRSQHVPLSSAPLAGTQGQLYFDDGTNTSTAEPGFRGSITTAPLFQDIPFYTRSTFTPTVFVGATAQTVVSTGVAIRIGGVCYVSVQVQWTKSADTGTVTIQGMPFTSAAVGRGGFIIANSSRMQLAPSGYRMSCRMLVGGTTVNILTDRTNATSVNNTDVQLTAGSVEFQFNGFYEIQ